MVLRFDWSGGPDACWVWTGTLDPAGYGRVRIDSERICAAHRVLYELCVGPIPEGHEMDHLCRNPPCVNPRHLEAVTRAEHAKRSLSATKPRCKNGHDFTPENTYMRLGGGRQCRQCQSAAVRAYKERKRAAA